MPTKKYLQDQLAESREIIAGLKSEIDRLAAEKKIDPAKGAGYLLIPAWATDSTIATIRYPVAALTTMGLNTEAKIKTALDAIDVESKAFHITPTLRNRTISEENDSTGTSNLPSIAEVNRKIIGKKVKIVLPKKINIAGGRGPEQRYASCRMPSIVPLAGFSLLQFWLNKAVDDESKVKFFYGPRGTVKYYVATSEAEAKKALAKGEKVAPTGTAAQGQGQA